MSAAAGRSQNTVRQDESPHEHRLLDGRLVRQPVYMLIKFMLVKRDPAADIVTVFSTLRRTKTPTFVLQYLRQKLAYRWKICHQLS